MVRVAQNLATLLFLLPSSADPSCLDGDCPADTVMLSLKTQVAKIRAHEGKEASVAVLDEEDDEDKPGAKKAAAKKKKFTGTNDKKKAAVDKMKPTKPSAASEEAAAADAAPPDDGDEEPAAASEAEAAADAAPHDDGDDEPAGASEAAADAEHPDDGDYDDFSDMHDPDGDYDDFSDMHDPDGDYDDFSDMHDPDGDYDNQSGVDPAGQYVVIQTGHCADIAGRSVIATSSECQAAAAALNLPWQDELEDDLPSMGDGDMILMTRRTGDPEGCADDWWDGIARFNSGHVGVGALHEEGFDQICKFS